MAIAAFLRTLVVAGGSGGGGAELAVGVHQPWRVHQPLSATLKCSGIVAAMVHGTLVQLPLVLPPQLPRAAP